MTPSGRCATKCGRRLDGDAVQAVLGPPATGPAPGGLPSGLTAREAEVLVDSAEGGPTRQIAAELHVSRKTVSSHLEHIYAKLGVKTRTEAALFAMRHGLAGPWQANPDLTKDRAVTRFAPAARIRTTDP